jgi:hypothetical protein
LYLSERTSILEYLLPEGRIISLGLEDNSSFGTMLYSNI